MNENQQKRVRPFGLRDKLGYMFGDFGNDFTFVLSSSFLLKFYTDVMGVSAGVVGIIMMLARFVDAFTDVAMGRICDRSRVTPVGKFKPWIRRMCGPVAIASFLIYQSSLASMPMTFKIGYLFVTYILWGSIFYTAVNIPYGSMASAISAEPGDRQSLSTYRSMGATLAGLVIGAGVPLVAYDKIDGNAVLNGGRFTIVAGIFSILAVVCYLLCYALTTERVLPERNHEVEKNNSVSVMFRNAVKNRALLSIIAASIVMLLAQLTMQSMANYVFPNYYGSPEAQITSTFMMVIGMVGAAAVAKPLANRFGKAEISVVSNLLAVAVCILLYLLRPENVWVYVVIQAVSWFGLGVFTMVSWALITDVIDYSEIKNGVREDGSVYALYSFARKLGQAAAAGLTGFLLDFIGYSAATAFDEEVLEGIFDISTLVPALGFGLLAAILWFWYPLHKKQVDANVEALHKKHGEGYK
ncbi:MAG: MFS transporter [Lachnospiraceae bacterium]|nr:MFS transporter [Lachnospiraceae bacterium]